MLAKARSGRGLVGHAEVQVDLEDINDNPPVFRRRRFVGSVAENSREGRCNLEDESGREALESSSF